MARKRAKDGGVGVSAETLADATVAAHALRSYLQGVVDPAASALLDKLDAALSQAAEEEAAEEAAAKGESDDCACCDHQTAEHGTGTGRPCGRPGCDCPGYAAG